MWCKELFIYLINAQLALINLIIINFHDIPWVAARAVRWPGIPKVALSRLTKCSKSCDLQPRIALCSGGTALCRVGGATSQLDLPSLTPLSVAGCGTWSSGGTALCRVGCATSQLDLSSLTPLSVAGCCRLQLGTPHWATSVNYC